MKYKCKIFKRGKNQSGITLVALVVTIVVLLILAGVSLSLILDNNGIINKSKDAKRQYQDAQQNDMKELAEIDRSIEKITNGNILYGKGTEESPYEINNIEDLIKFGYDIENGNNYNGKQIKLMKNLDFKSEESYENAKRTDFEMYGYTGELMTALTTGEGFKALGKCKVENEAGLMNESIYFQGTFDGNNKTIKNMYINSTVNEDTTKEVCVGLFANMMGTIKNLGIENSDITIKVEQTGRIRVGMLVGTIYGNNSLIDNCYARGSINVNTTKSNYTIIGGLVGTYNQGTTAVISNSYSSVDITTDSKNNNLIIGGLIGYSNEDQMTILNCYNKGEIECSGTSTLKDWVGGIVGYGKLKDCKNVYNYANVSVLGKVTKQSWVGGITGFIDIGNFEKCYNKGNIVSESIDSKVRYGGIAGGVSETVTISSSGYQENDSLTAIGRDYKTDREVIQPIEEEKMPTGLSIIGSAFKEDENNINKGYPILQWEQ